MKYSMLLCAALSYVCIQSDPTITKPYQRRAFASPVKSFVRSSIQGVASYIGRTFNPKQQVQEKAAAQKLHNAQRLDAGTGYTINLMWINKKLNPDQKYIHPSANEQELDSNLGNNLTGWAEKNPKSTVQLWYTL